MTSEVRANAQEKETGRIEAFSDGVFAIALTLLVLDIRVPGIEEADVGGLATALVHRWPNFLAFAVSFFYVLVM